MTTGTSDDFYVYMKYASRGEIKQGERVWQFSLTNTDKERINSCIKSGLKTFIILICGEESLLDGEIAVLTQSEYLSMSHKTGLRIKLQGKSPKKYIVADRQSSKALIVDRNRFDYKLTDIKDTSISGG